MNGLTGKKAKVVSLRAKADQLSTNVNFPLNGEESLRTLQPCVQDLNDHTGSTVHLPMEELQRWFHSAAMQTRPP